MTYPLSGWLFDVYANETDVSVWVIDDEGKAHHLHDELHPSFYVGGAPAELHRVCEWLTGARVPVHLERAERYDLFSQGERVVLAVQLRRPADYAGLVKRVANTFPTFDFFNADLTIAQFYFFERHLFPLAHCHVRVEEGSQRIVEIATDDSPWALDYALPPLQVMVLRLEGGQLNPNHGHRAPLEITCDGHTFVLQATDPRELVIRVREHLLRFDPDLIVSEWGDSFILPQLLEFAQVYGIPLPLSRDARLQTHTRPARSYFSYGRIIYKAASQICFGRWHIDVANAFLIDDYNLDGAFEVARLTRQTVQQAVRTSTGTGISAMEIATAYQNNYLIPFHKSEAEEWKSAHDLLRADKGGLTYQPLVGLHHDVAELDFASMYPAIMARFNVSPETMHCECGSCARVPEIGFTVCRRRRGLVPETLAPLIEKRLAYKRAARTMENDERRELYRRRASAHKWLLVTCFGYLGYKNARFGKIEAHEAVTAYGREALLRAKEIAEARGFRLLHALTDSLWIHKPRAQPAEYDALVRAIEQATHLPIALEGLYRWVAFLPSRVDERRAVPNRYFGATYEGELKIRGIECRRHDTPAWIKQVQLELLDTLAQTPEARDPAQGQSAALPLLLQIVAREVDRLRAGQVPFPELALTYHLSRAPEDYSSLTLNAIVARELTGRGVTLEPGESIRYVIMENDAAVPDDRARALEFFDGRWGYDVERYTELLMRAVETVVSPLGLNAQMLQDWLARELPAATLARRIQAAPSRPYLGPLFEWGRLQPA